MEIKVSAGQLALEYEGDEGFFSKEVPAFLELFLDQAAKLGTPLPTPVNQKASENEAGAADKGALPKHSTNTVAKLLNAQTGPDLIMAAVAKRVLVDGEETISRPTMIAEMKKASSYFKKTYTSNLSNYLDNLTKADSLRLVSEGVYGLPAKMRESLEPKLSEQ